MLASEGQGNNRAIPFINRYSNMSYVQPNLNMHEKNAVKMISSHAPPIPCWKTLSFDRGTFTSLTWNYPALVYHFEIMGMFTRHWSLNRDTGPAGRLGLETRVIVGFRPQRMSFLMCYLDAWVAAYRPKERGLLWKRILACRRCRKENRR